MGTQETLFSNPNDKDDNKIALGNGIFIEIRRDYPRSAYLYRRDILIKKVVLSDKIARRIFIVEAVELGAMKSRLASALKMSRQTIDNYLDTKKYFGLEGLVQGYSPSVSKSHRKQREIHANDPGRIPGNKAKQLAEIRREARENQEKQQQTFNFTFGYDPQAHAVAEDDQPYSEEHDWIKTRYAGVFVYVIALISQWRWLQLVMGYFGSAYKIFMVFVLMAAKNIRSLEQLKNVRLREGGVLLGLRKIPCKPVVWEWFYRVADRGISTILKSNYFRYQVFAGMVGIWLWFTDGHLLPYTGKARVHQGYNTQRRMPSPGQTNMVTCDGNGRIIDFEIQEGKGDLRSHIIALSEKWSGDLPEPSVMVFDREGSGVSFFSELVLKDIPFVTWEKNIDRKKLAAIDEESFKVTFNLNDKKYGVFEGEKVFTYKPKDADKKQHDFTLRRIYLWNKSSNRKTCGLAWTGNREMSTEECARAILGRWGASENTFKHSKERHPLHYHPGFKLKESKEQEIKNPVVKEKESIIKRLKKELGKLYKKFGKAKDVLKKDGTPRENSVKENLFDFVTVSIWNARKKMTDWLRDDYKHENDLVDLFYAITNCHGWIKSTKKEVIVRLEPLQQKSRRLAQERLCRKLTGLGATTPTGKWLKIEVAESLI